MPYRAPVADFRFLFWTMSWASPQVAATDRFAEATPETVEAILTEAGRLCEDVLAPLNRAGDMHPARLENGVGAHLARLRRGLSRDCRGRLGRHGGQPGIRRHGPADDRWPPAVNEMMSGGLPGAAAEPAADAGPDRGAGASCLGRAQGALPAEADLGRMVAAR